jgi:hypothetical protein
MLSGLSAALRKLSSTGKAAVVKFLPSTKPLQELLNESPHMAGYRITPVLVFWT